MRRGLDSPHLLFVRFQGSCPDSLGSGVTGNGSTNGSPPEAFIVGSNAAVPEAEAVCLLHSHFGFIGCIGLQNETLSED